MRLEYSRKVQRIYLNGFRLKVTAVNPLDNPINSDQKISYLVSLAEVMASNQKNSKKFVHKICHEPMRTDNIVMYFPKNFFLVGAINEKLSALTSSGIIEYFIQNFTKFNTKPIESGPKELNLRHLEGIFKILLIGCATSTLILLLENFHAKVFKKLKINRRYAT